MAAVLLAGCQWRSGLRSVPSPAEAGLNTRDLIDDPAQADTEELAGISDLPRIAEQARRKGEAPPGAPDRRNVLCLSGGGSYGAYSAGVLRTAWTGRGATAARTSTW